MAVATYTIANLSNINEYMGFTTGTSTSRDTFLEHLLDRASTTLESYCDRKFKSRYYRLERYDGDSSELLFLRQKPIRSIAQVSIGEVTALTVNCGDADAVHASIDVTSDGVVVNQINGTGSGTSNIAFSTYATISAVGAVIAGYTSWTASVTTGKEYYRSSNLLDVYGKYSLDTSLQLGIPDIPIYDFTVYREGGKQMGILHRNAGWSSGTMNIMVSYTAGYASTPPDMIQACVQLAAGMYNQSKRDPTLIREKLGDYEWQAAAGNASKSVLETSGVLELLSPYKQIWVVG